MKIDFPRQKDNLNKWKKHNYNVETKSVVHLYGLLSQYLPEWHKRFAVKLELKTHFMHGPISMRLSPESVSR